MAMLFGFFALIVVFNLGGASVICADQESECPDGTTCCPLPSGDYGCCPLPKAVCCSDELHCCPHGAKCDTTHQKCLDTATGTLSRWLVKFPARRSDGGGRNRQAKVVCPGDRTQCPAGNTCCRLSTGDWGCCPWARATCCSDQIHCCQHGTTCDTQAGTCLKSDGAVIPWSVKTKAELDSNKLCPDGVSECPDLATCCLLPSGKWGCCPMRKAVCCSDKIHCCPKGTECDVQHATCIQDDRRTIPWVEKVPARVVHRHRRFGTDTRCPGGNVTCPGESTCCKLRTGSWGCCPHPKGVCCSDQVHCCPQRYRCDTEHSRCIKDDLAVFASKVNPIPSEDRVTCRDGSVCKAPGTCCPHPRSFHYSCCPFKNAICCPNHCCPRGSRCSRRQNQCLVNAKKLSA